MLFHIFKSQEERRNYGGSAFIEIQYCSMPFQTDTKDLVAVEHIQHWNNDSLYISACDDSTFYREYGCIFDCGTYSNMKTGKVDLYGINYYAPNLIDSIIKRLSTEKPKDYEVLTAWLIRSKAYNGIYILGL